MAFPSLPDLLRNSEQIAKAIDHQASSLETQFTQKAPFNGAEAKQRLEENLSLMEQFIVQLSQSTLLHLNEWNHDLAQGQCDLDEIEGLLRRVRADAGAVLVGGGLAGPRPHGEEFPTDESVQLPPVKFPEYPYNMNMFTLDNVGHQVDDIARGIQALPPLIPASRPGQPAARFWTLTNDFFCPSTVPSDPKRWETSFSQFLRFDPVPPINSACA
jgi:hypothetical protein